MNHKQFQYFQNQLVKCSNKLQLKKKMNKKQNIKLISPKLTFIKEIYINFYLLFYYVLQADYNFYLDRSDMQRQSQYGRGRGSFKEGYDKAQTPDKNAQKSSFRAKKNVNFDPKEYMVAECSVRDIEIFKQVFDFLDDDYDGMLTPMDLRKAIREYGGYKPGRPFVYVAMSVFDTDDGGEITFKEFVKLMTQKPCEHDTEQDIERIFQNFDEDNKGFISQEDLIAAAEELNEQITPAEIKEMITQCDPDGEGVIKLQNFIAFNKRKTFD